MYALLSIVTKGTAHRLLLVYCLNSLFYLFLLFLVMLDSDIVYAASIGDWLPLAANVVGLPRSFYMVYLLLKCLMLLQQSEVQIK